MYVSHVYVRTCMHIRTYVYAWCGAGGYLRIRISYDTQEYVHCYVLLLLCMYVQYLLCHVFILVWLYYNCIVYVHSL